jgi:outer membrane protein
MLKRFITALCMTLMIIFVAGTLSANDGKIAYIDTQRILSESDPGKTVYKQLSSMKEKKEAAARKMRDKLNSVRETIQAKSATMTPAANGDLKVKYEHDLNEYERYVQDAKDDLRKTEIKLVYPLGKELDGIIKSYAEKNGIDIVLNKANPVIVHASNKIDITNPIMNLFNKLYKEKSDKAKKG